MGNKEIEMNDIANWTDADHDMAAMSDRANDAARTATRTGVWTDDHVKACAADAAVSLLNGYDVAYAFSTYADDHNLPHDFDAEAKAARMTKRIVADDEGGWDGPPARYLR